MTENMKNFLDAASKDAEVMKKLNGTKDPSEFIAVANRMGFALTEKDFYIRGSQDKKELDDDDLDSITGGIDLSFAIG